MGVVLFFFLLLLLALLFGGGPCLPKGYRRRRVDDFKRGEGGAEGGGNKYVRWRGMDNGSWLLRGGWGAGVDGLERLHIPVGSR